MNSPSRGVQKRRKMPKKTVIHVNQHKIKSNRKNGCNEPVITCKDYQQNRYGHEVIIFDANGIEAARVIYRPEAPLSCGAVCWIETYNKVEVRDGRINNR